MTSNQTVGQHALTDPLHDTASHMLTICPTFQLRRVSRLVTQIFDQSLSPTGLRSTQVITMLGIITQQGANLSQLSKYLDMDASTLSRGLGTLQKAGLVREIDLGNRNKTYQLTPQGQRAVNAAAPYWEKALKRFEEQLAPTDWHDVVNRLQAVGVALRTPQHLD